MDDLRADLHMRPPPTGPHLGGNGRGGSACGLEYRHHRPFKRVTMARGLDAARCENSGADPKLNRSLRLSSAQGRESMLKGRTRPDDDMLAESDGSSTSITARVNPATITRRVIAAAAKSYVSAIAPTGRLINRRKP
jgi:hypothetical protein